MLLTAADASYVADSQHCMVLLASYTLAYLLNRLCVLLGFSRACVVDVNTVLLLRILSYFFLSFQLFYFSADLCARFSSVETSARSSCSFNTSAMC